MHAYNDSRIQLLIQALLCLETEDECRAFLEDLMTIKELQDLTQRLEVARCLYSGQKYAEISTKTGASSATITRVNRCCNFGAGGYQTVLSRMKD